ncbi:hypothetical protein ABZW49_15815 [Nonomuraea wenchangensis]
MAVGESAYDEILSDLKRRLPGLALQLEDEVLRGRTVAGSDLSDAEKADRGANLRAAEVQGGNKLKGIEDGDVAVVPYGEDERLDLMWHALLRLAETMYGSRLEVLELVRGHGIASPTIQFERPDGAENDEISLPEELAVASNALAKVQQLFEPWERNEGTQ